MIVQHLLVLKPKAYGFRLLVKSIDETTRTGRGGGGEIVFTRKNVGVSNIVPTNPLTLTSGDVAVEFSVALRPQRPYY